MAITITDKMLSIPPYISSSWSRIASLHMKDLVLAITLVDGETIHIPGLANDQINLIFQYHAAYLENEHLMHPLNPDPKRMMDQMGEPSIRFAIGPSLDNLGSIMQHNPDQMNAPDLPPEVLDKIRAVSKIISSSEEIILPHAEAGCNCFHCQIARAVDPNPTIHFSTEEQEEIKKEDLEFQQWTITQIGNQLYSVVNKLDDHEKYNVYLGQPIGCTCGKEGCEHIVAVLKS